VCKHHAVIYTASQTEVKLGPASTLNLPSLTFWQPDPSLPRTILWTTPLIWRSAPE